MTRAATTKETTRGDGPSKKKRPRYRLAMVSQLTRAEFGGADFGDKRLNDRFCGMMSQMVSRPSGSIPETMGDMPATVGAYRFFNNRKVTVAGILDAHRRQTVKRCRAESQDLIAIADTTTIDFPKRPGTKGLGPTAPKYLRGFYAQPLLVATADKCPLGLAEVDIWIRKDEDYGRSNRVRRCKHSTIAEKESGKWIRSLEGTARLAEDVGRPVTMVADREGDVYSVLVAARRLSPNVFIVVRSIHNRKIPESDQRLWDDVAQTTVVGVYDVEIEAHAGRMARTAKMQLKFVKRTLQPPPKRAKGDDYNEPVTVTAILAEEIDAPASVTPLNWKLITTREVENFEDALACVKIYAARWLIETFFQTLKGECRTKERQLKTADRLKKALVADMIIAYFILHLTKYGREHPEEPSTNIFENHQWKLIWLCADRREKLPEKPPSIGDVIERLGQIGGHLQRKNDGPVGVKILRRAFEKVVQFAEGFYTCAETLQIDLDRHFA